MLQNNALTGLLFLAGICCGSYLMGIAAILATVTGTCTAWLFHYKEEEINSGLYGFSAALVGVALICFFQFTVIIWASIIVGSVLATILQHLFIIKKMPAFTFPFILVTWLFLVIVHYYPALVRLQPAATSTYANDYLALCSHGFGQVIFQDNIWAGILFSMGIFIHRPIAAIYATVSIALSAALAYWFKEPVQDIFMGLLSYNAVLCAITFAGKKVEDLIFGAIAVILSVLIMILMRHWSLPALTFPFVLATWIVLMIKNAREIATLKLQQ